MYQHPNDHIRIFRKRWSLILGCFFPVSILKDQKTGVFDESPSDMDTLLIDDMYLL